MYLGKSIKNLIYPWFSVWYKPRKTIKYVVQYSPLWVFLLLTLYPVLSNTKYLTIFTVLVYLTIISIFSRILGGRASSKEISFVYFLSLLPIAVAEVLDYINTYVESSLFTSLLPFLFFILIVWALVIFVIMLSEVEHFSEWRAFLVMLVGFIMPMALTIMIKYRMILP